MIRSSAKIASTTSPGEAPLLHEVTGSGDPLVLMPGALTGWASWESHADHLAGTHTVVRAQLRSVELAEAGKPIPESYSVATEREALLAMADALGLPRFDLAGWSLGALVSLAFALEYPDRVRTLTLIEPPAIWLLRQTKHDTEPLAAIEASDRALAGHEVTIEELKGFLDRAGLLGPDGTFESHPRWPLMLRNRQALSVNTTVWDHNDSLAQLRALEMPVLAIKGTDTAPFLAQCTDVVVANTSNATLVELPGNHSCHLQHPERFREVMETHIARHAR